MNRELEIVYDNVAFFVDGRRVLDDVGILGFSTNESARMVEQPLEDGSSVIDHKIDDLTVITFNAILPTENYRNAYEVLNAYFIEGTIFSIKTPLRYFESAIIQSLPVQMRGDTPDRVQIALSFKQYRFFEAQFAVFTAQNVSRPQLASTVDRGTQQGEAVQVDRSTAFRLLAGESGDA